MVSVHWDTARILLAMMKEIRGDGDQARRWLEQLNQPRFAPVLYSCGRWEAGRHLPLPPERFLYLLFNAWRGEGNLQLPPEQVQLQTHLERVYAEVDGLEQALAQYSERMEEQLSSAIKREVFPWLPERVELDYRVEITLGAPLLGFVAAGVIYLDLLAVAELGRTRAEQYISHQLFHFAHRRLARGRTDDDQLWACLFSLQSEGVVNYIIGGSREMLELRYKFARGPLREQLLHRLEHYAAFPRKPAVYFEKLYCLVETALAGDPASLVKYCREIDPGHYQGVAMARTIEAQLGAHLLKESLYHPVDFLLAWARTDGGEYIPFPTGLGQKLEQYKRERKA